MIGFGGMVTGIEKLRRALIDRDVVMLVGAGISMDPPAGLPDWTSLRDLTIAAVAARHSGLPALASLLGEVPMISVPDRKGLAPEMVASFISSSCSGYFESFRALEEGEPNYNHRLIAAIAKEGLIKYILTTNFDMFLEGAFVEAEVPCRAYRNDEEFQGFHIEDDAHVHLLKLHGSIDLPQSITATVEQEAKGLSAAKVSVLDGLVSGRWLGVWGYSGADLKIDLDYLRLLQNRGTCRGFFWNMFQDAHYTEQPNSFVVDIAKAYSPDSVAIMSGLFPIAFEKILDSTSPPAKPTFDARQRETYKQRKNQQLQRYLKDWAHSNVSGFAACIILGDLLRYAGYSTEAMYAYKEGEAQAGQESDLQALAYAFAMQAVLASEIGAFDTASMQWQRTIQLADNLGETDLLVYSLSGRMSLANRQGDPPQAERLNAIIRSIRFRDVSDQLIPTFLLDDLALMKRSRGNYDEAYAYFTEAAKRHRASGDRKALALALRGMASANLKFGEFREAYAALDEAKESDAAISNRTGVVANLAQLAQIQIASGEYYKAAACLDEAESMAQTIADQSLSLSVREVRLMWYSVQPNIRYSAIALSFAEATVVGLRRLGEFRRLGMAMTYQANMLKSAGDPARALEVRRESLQLLLRSEDRLNAGHLAEIMADEAFRQEDHESAFTFYQLAISSFRIAGQHDLAASLLIKMRPTVASLEASEPWAVQSIMEIVSGIFADKERALKERLGYETSSASLADCIRDVARSSGEAAAIQRLNVAIKEQSDCDFEEKRDWSEWSIAGLRLSSLVRDDYAAGIYMNDLGLAAKQKGNLQRAIECYTGAATIARNLMDFLEESVRMHNLAIVLVMADRREEAVSAALRAGESAISVVRAGRLQILMGAATLLDEFEQWDAALDCFTEAAYEASGTLEEKILARAYQGRGKALRERGSFIESSAAREAAARVYHSLGARLEAAYMLFLAGNTLIEVPGNQERARTLLTTALESDAARDDENLVALVTTALAKIK
jgi:tetratricopeptide (TPR) repeat protein